MGFVGILRFALSCVHLFAWPVLALGYPLCASVRAIETNSNYHMRKLVSYWILFSLISLFELAFLKIIEWIPIWPYIKMVTICWLVIPRFSGAYYIYKHLVHPCLSVNLQEVINWLSKRQERLLKTETFLSVAERYIKENGTEALEELIANKGAKPNIDTDKIKAVAKTKKEGMATTIKSKDEKPNTDAEEIKAIPNTEAKEMATAAEVKGGKSNLVAEEIKVVENTEKKEMTTTIESKCKESTVAQKDIRVVEATETNAAAAVMRVKHADANLAQTETKAVAAVEGNEMPAPSENGFAALNKVQKEWTCAVCQVTTTSATTLNSHLQGKKHRAKYKELKASTQAAAAKNKTSSVSMSSSTTNGPNVNETKKQKKSKNAVDAETKQCNKLRCSLCNVSCPTEFHMDSHLCGKQHLSRVREMANLSGWLTDP